MAKKLLKGLLRTFTSVSVFRYTLLFLTKYNYLPRAIWIRLPVTGTYQVNPIPDCSFKYTFVPGDLVGNNLFWKGTFETTTARLFFEFARTARSVLDIGSNTGYYTLLACAANPSANVISFEPVPAIRQALEKNIQVNNWQRRCSIFPHAVSNSIGIAEFSVLHGEIPASSSLNPQGFRGKRVSQILRVPTTTIDSMCGDRDDIDLVKIDVEGFEDKVLEGMSTVLTTLRPALIIEYNHDGPYQSVEQFLRKHGYAFFYRIEEKGPRRVSSIAPDEDDQDRNYFCTVSALDDRISFTDSREV